MEISLTEQEAADLAHATSSARQVRQWRRYRAIQLLAEDQTPQQGAAVLGCSLASVYNWAATWHQQGRQGLAEARPAGRTRLLDTEALRLLEHWLETDPQTLGEQTTGWTVPLLPTRLTRAGYPISQRALRRAVHRLGWRWKRPKDVLGRSDLAYEENKGRWSHGSNRQEPRAKQRGSAMKPPGVTFPAALCLGQTGTTAGGCDQRTQWASGAARRAAYPERGTGPAGAGAQPHG
jgi:transposase